MSSVGKWQRNALDVALPATSDQRAVLTTELGADGASDQLVWVGRDQSGNFAKSVIAPRTQATFVGTAPSLALAAAAGSTATVSGSGVDSAYALTLTPNGTGIAAGKILTVTFGTPRTDSYNVHFALRNAAAANAVYYTTNRTATGFEINVVSALTSGAAINLGYSILGF